jgi:general secretion pathway protein J
MRHSARGFTLIELLVAISIMALMAMLSWRGIDGMSRAQSQLQERADDALTLQVGLAQWRTDLNAMVNLPGTAALDWDGRVLRLTRRHPLSEPASLQVVAWTLRNDGGTGAGRGSWIRWQSAAISQRADWTAAWSRAQTWGQTPNAEDRAQEVPVRALSQWQIFFHRGGAWSNPLSSEGTTPATPGSASNTAPGGPPDGIRLVLDLPAGPSLSGKLTLDWVSPTLTGAAP